MLKPPWLDQSHFPCLLSMKWHFHNCQLVFFFLNLWINSKMCAPRFFRLQEILEVADDMAIDIPHIWLYLAELLTPMLLEGGIPMGEFFRLVNGKHFTPQWVWQRNKSEKAIYGSLLTCSCILSPGRFQSLWSLWEKLESYWSRSSLYSAKEWWDRSSLTIYNLSHLTA